MNKSSLSRARAQAHPRQERTFMLVKPDGVKRGLVGECITRIEQRGLKVIALKLVRASKAHAAAHYPGTKEWLQGMGEKTLETYAKYAKDPIQELGTADPLKIGKMIHEWNADYMSSGPVAALIVEGIHAVDMVRKIVGKTLPAFAEMGTIRGDYSVDSPVLANDAKRAIHNLVHASGDSFEAAHEIAHWFSEKEIHAYPRAEEEIMF